eukprot:gene1078-1627_t
MCRDAAVKDRELRSVLALFDIALEKHPATFFNGRGVFAVQAFCRLLPLVTELRFRGPVHEALLSTLSSILSLVATGNNVCYYAFIEGAADLLEDLHEVADLMSGPAAHFAAATKVTVQGFILAFETALASEPQPAPSSARSGSDSQQLECTLSISSEQWEPLARTMLHIVGHGLQSSLPAVVATLAPHTVSCIAGLLPLGSPDFQKVGCDVLARLAIEMDSTLFPAEDVLEALIQIFAQLKAPASSLSGMSSICALLIGAVQSEQCTRFHAAYMHAVAGGIRIVNADAFACMQLIVEAIPELAFPRESSSTRSAGDGGAAPMLLEGGEAAEGPGEHDCPGLAAIPSAAENMILAELAKLQPPLPDEALKRAEVERRLAAVGVLAGGISGAPRSRCGEAVESRLDAWLTWACSVMQKEGCPSGELSLLGLKLLLGALSGCPEGAAVECGEGAAVGVRAAAARVAPFLHNSPPADREVIGMLSMLACDNAAEVREAVAHALGSVTCLHAANSGSAPASDLSSASHSIHDSVVGAWPNGRGCQIHLPTLEARRRRRALHSLAVLVELIGNRLPQYVPQVMALLTNGLEYPDALPVALAIWRRFVRALGAHAPQRLRQVAHQIVVVLLPHLEEAAPQVRAAAGVLHELLVVPAHRKALGTALHRLPMLPAHAALQAANAVLEQERGAAPLQQRLQRLADSLQAESHGVRLAALKELQRMTGTQRESLGTLLLQSQAHTQLSGGGQSPEGELSVASVLYTALLKCCCVGLHTAVANNVRYMAAQVLGELGAADPARVQVVLPPPPKIICNDHAFARALLEEHLVRVLRTAYDLDMLETAAFSIQELLKSLDCRLLDHPAAPPPAMPAKSQRKSGGAKGAAGAPSLSGKSAGGAAGVQAKPLLQRQLTFAGAEQATSLAGGGWAAAAGGGLCCLSPETWGALVTKLATEELAPETVVACLGGVQRVVAHAVPNQLHGSRDALQECLRMIAHPHRPVREALADMLPTLMHPSVLQEIYGSDLITPAEHCLLHAIRDVLETAPDQEVRSTALAMFSQVARSASGLVPDTPDIVLIVLVGRLDDPDWGLRAAAVEAIQEEATRRHVPTKEMILYQSKRVLSYIGQNLCEKPDVAVMVAEALLDGMNLQSFLGTVLEVVVASLVAKGDRPNLEEFARLIERPLPALMLDYTPWFIADLVLDEDMDREEKDRHIIFFQEMLEEESLEDAVGRHAVTVVQKLVEQAGSRDEEYAAAGEMDAGTCIDNTAELLKDKVAALAQMQQMDQVDVPEYLSRDFLQHLADVSNQLKRDTAAAPSRRDQLCLGGMQARGLLVLPHAEEYEASTAAPPACLTVAASALLPVAKKLPARGRRGKAGAEFWARLPEDLQEVVAPCLSSKYVMQTFHPQRVAAVPIFANARHLSFRRWLVQWSRHMLAGAAGPRLKMLEASQGVWRFDSGAVQYLLPYLVHAVVCYGTPAARDDVLAELLAVLEEAGHGSGSRVAPARGGEASGGLTGGSGTATATRTELSAQAVFTLLDQLQQWVEQQRELEPSSGASAKSGQSLPSMQSSQPWLEEEVCKMERFLEAIPKEALTHASRSCRANARALMYFETHVRCMPGGGALNQASKRTVTLSEADVSLLRDVYSGLEEPDGLEGLACLRQAPLLEDEMWLGEQAGRWWEALTLHELAQRSDTDPGASTSARRGGSPAPAASAQAEPKVLALPAPGEGRAQRPGRAPGEAQGGSAGGSGPKAAEHGRLRCLLGAGHLESVLGQVDGLLSRPGNQEELRAYGVAAAWRLGRWDRVSEFLGPAGAGAGTAAGDTQSRRGAGAGNARGGVQEAFEVSLGKVLLALEQRDEPKLYSTVKDARAALLAPLAAASMESYDRAYPYLVQLHLLQEAEASWPALAGSASHASTTPGRGASPAANCQVVGPKESARILGAEGARLERAKLLWQRGDLTSAMSDLQLAVQAHSTGGGTGNQRLRAKELIQLANMVHRTGQKEKTAVIQYYHKAIAASKSWEKGYFYFASYLDALLQDAMGRTHQPKPAPAPPVRGKEQASQGSGDGVQEYLLQTVRHYGMSLKYGHKHIYQSLPRMLTLWLDFGERSAGSTGSAAGLSMRASMPRSTPQSAQKKVMADLNQLMERMVKELPAYQWYTALPQLTSRICHPVPEVQTLVKRILGRIVGEFPQQALWFLALVARSTHHARKQHGSEVLNAAKQQTSSEDKRIRDLHTQFGQIIDQLIKLCFEKPKTPDGVRKAANKPFLVSRDFGVLKRMMPLHVMVPIQTALTATLPTDGCTHMEHAPFGQLAQVTVHSLVEEVEVMASLQKPKKLTIIGSDGKHYSFLCKPKDDLRKDMRMMELNGMLNRLLAKERESRRRKLYLRTFAVVPLTEECGLVEWVPNTRGLRHILQELYEAAGIFVRRANQSLAQLKMIYEKHQNPEQRMQLSCKMFPPIFHRWFLACFPEPAAWFRARAAFAHTAAVWSMVGHTVGLGDRHGENLLLDCTTADCVHVDFSCLFDKGLELECPECVPFRLTQNLVDGCGITGYEGMFSKVCEITLKVLRENRESMMSVLETFVHDPLLEWTTAAMRRQTTEEPNNRPRKALDKIKSRLEENSESPGGDQHRAYVGTVFIRSVS